MFTTPGKCPKCETTVSRLQIHVLTASESPIGEGGWKAVTYKCPSCNAILGAQIDPVALKTDIVEQTVAGVLKALKRS